MRIAVLTEYYPDEKNPGSGVYVHTRASAYARAGHDVRVYRVGAGASSDSEYDGVSLFSSDREAAESDIKRFAPDVVALHTPYPGAAHVQLAESLEVPRVVWIHGYEAMFTALHGYQRGVGLVTSLIHDLFKLERLKRSLRRATDVVFVSEWMRRVAERSMRYSHHRSAVVPNPVDTELFRPTSGNGTGSAPMRGLALRGLRAKYGLDVAVRAYSGIDTSDLTIVGTGPDADRLRAEIERRRAPVRLDERGVHHRDIPRLISSYDYFVAPGRTEAQGVAMCEAMACGLPVVASRVGGIPEFVRDEVDGLLFPRGDVDALQAAVRELISDPDRAAAMGRSAREHAELKCSARVVIPRELELLAEAAR